MAAAPNPSQPPVTAQPPQATAPQVDRLAEGDVPLELQELIGLGLDLEQELAAIDGGGVVGDDQGHEERDGDRRDQGPFAPHQDGPIAPQVEAILIV